MKPRNKTERRVVELSATLPPLRESDKARMKWEHKHYWNGKGLCYFLVLERCREFQVIRYYYHTSKSLFEFAQIFINKETKIVLAKDRWMGVDKWKKDSDITIKNWFRKSYDYSYLGGVDRIGWSGAIVRSLLPELKRRGLKTSTHNINPYVLIECLLNNNRIETLFKIRQYNLVKYFAYNPNRLSDCVWQSIRIALRNGYHWEDRQEVSDWVDMVRDLNTLGLDTRSPHYICPKYLAEAHQYWSDKVRERRNKEREKEVLAKIMAYETTFNENRKSFLDMEFVDGNIVVQTIPTAMAIREEGKAMHHCVEHYYNRPESLILSAKVDGKRMETIEVCLSSYELVQSRGLQNKETEYHDRIVRLVNENMKEIRKRNKIKIAV